MKLQGKSYKEAMKVVKEEFEGGNCNNEKGSKG